MIGVRSRGWALPSVTPVRARSLWLEQALEEPGLAVRPALREDREVDVCIIGGGYVGMWTAIRIKEQDPTVSVVLLEADVCGSGASGRNAGMAMSQWQKIGTLVSRFGPEVAATVAAQSVEDIDEIRDFSARHDFDPQLERPGWIMAASAESQLGAWDSFVDKSEQLGATPYVRLSRDEVCDRTGSTAFVGGIFDPSVATLQPARLAFGLRQATIDLGVEVYENSPVRRITSGREVRTDFGAVTARQSVVMTLGGWTPGVSGFGRTTVGVASDVVATEPMPDRLKEHGWDHGRAITTARMTLRYARPTRDGRLVFGWGGSAVAVAGRVRARFDGTGTDRGWAEREIGHYLTNFDGAKVTHRWSGPVDRSADGLPFLHVADGPGPKVICASGFSGNGIVPSVSAGRSLASLALDINDQWSRHPLVRPHGGLLPIEPFRSAGGVLVRQAIHRVEDRDELGKPSSWPVRTLAAQAPSGLVTLSREK